MVFNGEKTCENCAHKNVCGHKDDFEEYIRKANEITVFSNMFDYIVQCKEFRKDVAVRTPFGK